MQSVVLCFVSNVQIFLPILQKLGSMLFSQWHWGGCCSVIQISYLARTSPCLRREVFQLQKWQYK